MVGNRRSEEVVDRKLPEMPSSKALKRALLVALRCVDPDATKRPKMGHVIHMLEADDLLFRDRDVCSTSLINFTLNLTRSKSTFVSNQLIHFPLPPSIGTPGWWRIFTLPS